MPRLLLFMVALALAGCGAEPEPAAVRRDAPKPSPEHERADALRTLRQSQHALRTEAEAVDAEIVKATSATPAFLVLTEAAKIATIRESLEQSRPLVDIARPDSARDDLKRLIALGERRIDLHDELADVERQIAALGERP